MLYEYDFASLFGEINKLNPQTNPNKPTHNPTQTQHYISIIVNVYWAAQE